MADWDFLYWWWWKPIIDPILGLLWLAFFILLGVLLYSFVASRTKLDDYRNMLKTPEELEAERNLPEDEDELSEFLRSYYPEVSEEEIEQMEDVLAVVLREDIHPDMLREITERGIPVRLLDLPSPGTVKDVGGLALAVWIPQMEAIEIYACPMKMHCRGDARAYRPYMGNLLLHEMGHALGLGESKIKDFGV
ncbi:MAG: hypothetical protein V3V56_07295 [bacterium]